MQRLLTKQTNDPTKIFHGFLLLYSHKNSLTAIDNLENASLRILVEQQ